MKTNMFLKAFLFVLIFGYVAAQDAPPLGSRCSKARLRVNCATHVGIFWRIGAAGFQTALTVDKYHAIDCPANTHCIVVVCNFANSESNGDNIPVHKPKIPTLVKSIGEKSTVSIHVFKSGNVKVQKGSYLHRGNIMRTGKPALIGNLINTTTIGAEATIALNIQHSANINLKKSTSFFARHAHLIEPLVQSTGCIKNACLDVDILDSGNVIASGENNHVLLSQAALVQNVIQSQCVEAGSQFVHLRQSSDVRNVASIIMGNSSKLTGSLVQLGLSKNTPTISIDMADCARVTASGNVEVRDGSHLLNSALTANEEQSSKVLLKMENVANKVATSTSGSSIGKVVNMKGSNKSEVNAFVKNCAIITSATSKDVKAIESIVSIDGDAEESTVQATLTSAANVEGDKVEIATQNKLIGTVVHVAGKVTRGTYTVFVTKSGNVRPKSSVSVTGNLVGGFVNLGDHVDGAHAKVTAKQSANLLCSTDAASSSGSANAQVSGLLLEKSAHLKGTNGVLNDDLSVCGNSFVPISNAAKLIDTMVTDTKSIHQMHLIQSFVGQRLTCSAVPLLNVFQF